MSINKKILDIVTNTLNKHFSVWDENGDEHGLADWREKNGEDNVASFSDIYSIYIYWEDNQNGKNKALSDVDKAKKEMEDLLGVKLKGIPKWYPDLKDNGNSGVSVEYTFSFKSYIASTKIGKYKDFLDL